MLKNVDFDILVIRDYYPSVNNPSSSTWVYNQVASLQEMGYKPLVISPTPINPIKKLFPKRFNRYDKPSYEYEEYLNTTVLRPPYYKVPRNKLKGLTLHNLSKVILKHGCLPNIKLIHAHFGQNGIAALALKKELRVPLITSFYGYDTGRLGEIFKPYYKELAAEGDLFLVLSQDMKNDLKKLGFPEERIRIHHLGIDLSTFVPISNDGRNDFIFCTACRLDKSKGVQFVIKAFKNFLSKNHDQSQYIQLRIVGGGTYEHQLKKMVHELNLTNNVKFINNLLLPNSREIIVNEMQLCDVFLLASHKSNNNSKEGTPVVLMEAQACGKPCISTDHAGIPEVVIDGYSGFIVPEESVDDIQSKMQFFYDDKLEKGEFGSNARKHIEMNFNQEVQMKALNTLYKRILNL